MQDQPKNNLNKKDMKISMSFHNAKCPICGNTKHVLHNKNFILSDIDIDEQGNAKPTGSSIRLRGLICNQCGYLMLFKSAILEGA